ARQSAARLPLAERVVGAALVAELARRGVLRAAARRAGRQRRGTLRRGARRSAHVRHLVPPRLVILLRGAGSARDGPARGGRKRTKSSVRLPLITWFVARMGSGLRAP